MTDFRLDRDTALETVSPGRFRIQASDFYRNMGDVVFGGWAIATAIEAVLTASEGPARLVGMNAVFANPVVTGTYDIEVRALKSGKRTSFYKLAMRRLEEPDIQIFDADMILSDRPESAVEFASEMPDVVAPESVETLRFPGGAGPSWFTHYDQRLVEGRYFEKNERPRNRVWIRDGDGRPLDAKGLAAISDTLVPRTFFMGPDMRIAATAAYSLYIFATDEELAAIGNEFVLIEGDSDRVRSGLADQRGRIWSRDGRLLATTTQLSFFR